MSCLSIAEGDKKAIWIDVDAECVFIGTELRLVWIPRFERVDAATGIVGPKEKLPNEFYKLEDDKKVV